MNGTGCAVEWFWVALVFAQVGTLSAMTLLDKRVQGKVALITGAASGMGASHARVLAAHGAKVVIADLNDAQGQKLADEIGEDMALYTHLDVTSFSDWERAVDKALER